MTKIIYSIIVFSIGYFSITEIKDQYHQHKKASYEKSLFPRIDSLPDIQGFRCKPEYIYFSDTQFFIFCDGIASKDKLIRSEIVNSVKFEYRKWSAENNLPDLFNFIFFTDEISSGGAK